MKNRNHILTVCSLGLLALVVLSLVFRPTSESADIGTITEPLHEKPVRPVFATPSQPSTPLAPFPVDLVDELLVHTAEKSGIALEALDKIRKELTDPKAEERRQEKLERLSAVAPTDEVYLDAQIAEAARGGNERVLDMYRKNLAKYKALNPRQKAMRDANRLIQNTGSLRQSKAFAQVQGQHPDAVQEFWDNEPANYASTREADAEKSLRTLRFPYNATERDYKNVVEWMRHEIAQADKAIESGTFIDPQWHIDRKAHILALAENGGFDLAADNLDWAREQIARDKAAYEATLNPPQSQESIAAELWLRENLPGANEIFDRPYTAAITGQ